jgi:hypothetical protein
MNTFTHPVTRQPVKLGRTLARRNAKSRLRAARLHSFLSTLPTAPTSADYTFGITSWGMMKNDSLGDCTIAGPGHMIQSWTASSGSEATVPDSVILGAYEAWDGYVNGDPSTDNGGDILTVCQDWQTNGLGGYGITAHAEVNMTQLRWQQGVYVFGGLNTGVQLPISAQSQVGSLWDVVGDGQTGDSAPGSWGGHCTAIVGYDTDGVTLVTWGALQRATWAFVMAYYDEAHAIISPNFKTPAGINVSDLAADLQQIGS